MTGTNHPIEALCAEYEDAKSDLKAAQARMKRIQGLLDETFALEVEAALTRTGKGAGSVSISKGDITIEASITKKVEWDAEKLLRALDDNWDELKTVVSLEAGIPEKAYAKLVPEKRALVDDARTVRFGDPKVALVRTTGDDQEVAA